jgi:hypothetical protein
MIEAVARLVLAGTLLVAAVAKLSDIEGSRAGVETYGFRSINAQALALAVVIAAELALALGVALGVESAYWLAAALMAMFALTTVGAILRGQAGAPCACFGPRSRIGWRGVGRDVVLATGFAALPFLPEESVSTDEWLGIGLGFAFVAIAALGAAVLALAREVGLLRLRVGPSSAIEIAGEGPDLGTRVALASRFSPGPDAELALAVFTSPGCRVCRSLEPTVKAFARLPVLALETFDEVGDREVWEELGIPGSPYAVALDLDGRVLAKGTFNNHAQLESGLATAERRRGVIGTIEGLGV